MMLTETLERYSGIFSFLRLAHIAMLKYYVALTNTFASPVSKMLTKQHSQQFLCSANAKVGSLCQTQGAQEQQRLLQDLSHGWQVSFSGGVKQHLWNLRKKSLRENQCDNLCFKIPNLFSDDHQERPTSCVLPPSSHQRCLNHAINIVNTVPFPNHLALYMQVSSQLISIESSKSNEIRPQSSKYLGFDYLCLVKRGNFCHFCQSFRHFLRKST